MAPESKELPNNGSQGAERRFALENRRYIGCKAKLADWIFRLIAENTRDIHSFCDMFAGTGVVSKRALEQFERVVINDFLFSNRVIYDAFFADSPWDEARVLRLVDEFNSIRPSRLAENYFSKNFGDKFFSRSTAKIVGHVRGRLKALENKLTEKELAILLASLIYSVDRRANTLGHFDAFIKKRIVEDGLFEMRLVEAGNFPGAEIFQEDANSLARRIHVDVTYIDPPYNSRQYSRFYHVYENLVQWKKPELFGVAMKPKEELMSRYCRSDALAAFTDLVARVASRYLVVSYNNTYRSKSSSSENKIKLEEIESVLRQCGETKVFSHKFSPFNSGKTEFEDHREFLFITEVDDEKRNRAFAALLRG